jgi:hypothetical protein
MDLFVSPFLGPMARHEIDLAVALDIRDALVERPPCGQPRTVREQIAESHGPLAVHAEIGEEARHSIVQTQLAVARQYHHGDSGGENLRERREVEYCLDPHRGPFRHDCARAECTLEGDIVALAHDDRRSGKNAALNSVVERLLYLTPSQN